MTMATKTISKEEAEAYLYREARLLDERRLDDWQRLFTDDGIYWVPAEEGLRPDNERSIIYDDPLQRRMRVHQLTKYKHLSQEPASRTVHVVSNVEVEVPATRRSDDVSVHCTQIVFEMRPGNFVGLPRAIGEQRALAGRCEYLLRHDGAWKIAMKKVLLIERDIPQYNLTFIF